MNDGLIQFLVVAVFIIVSMMDGAARKRRKQAQSLGTLPEPNRLSEMADDVDQTAESSEGMVPEDLWQEISALARGERPGLGVDAHSGPATGDADSTSDLDFARDPDSELEVWTAPQEELPQMRTPAAESGRRAEPSAESYDGADISSLTKTPTADLQSGYLHADQAASHEKHAHEKHVEVAFPDRPLPAERPHEFVPHSPKNAEQAAEGASPRPETAGSALGGQARGQGVPPGGHNPGRGVESSGNTTRLGLETSVLAPRCPTSRPRRSSAVPCAGCHRFGNTRRPLLNRDGRSSKSSSHVRHRYGPRRSGGREAPVPRKPLGYQRSRVRSDRAIPACHPLRIEGATRPCPPDCCGGCARSSPRSRL